mmetsp:Transcript_32353/g.84832  ORF Transcript_32353/g.84832 Transcript_32353/m.84832 type:complete len:245 (+) Transcript_32353:396-1130(+)
MASKSSSFSWPAIHGLSMSRKRWLQTERRPPDPKAWRHVCRLCCRSASCSLHFACHCTQPASCLLTGHPRSGVLAHGAYFIVRPRRSSAFCFKLSPIVRSSSTRRAMVPMPHAFAASGPSRAIPITLARSSSSWAFSVRHGAVLPPWRMRGSHCSLRPPLSRLCSRQHGASRRGKRRRTGRCPIIPHTRRRLHCSSTPRSRHELRFGGYSRVVGWARLSRRQKINSGIHTNKVVWHLAGTRTVL